MPLLTPNNVTVNDLNSLTNLTEGSHQIFTSVNGLMGGWWFFMVLVVFWFILYTRMGSRNNEDDPGRYFILSGAVVVLISFLARAVFVITDGVFTGLLTDMQLWIFPIVVTLAIVFRFSTRN